MEESRNDISHERQQLFNSHPHPQLGKRKLRYAASPKSATFEEIDILRNQTKSVLVQENYFDHLGLPDSSNSDESFKVIRVAAPDLTRSLHEDRRIIRKNSGPAHRKIGSFGGGLENIVERNNDISNGSVANYCYSPSNVMEETIAPVVPVDDFSSDFNSQRHHDRPICVLKSSMGKSLQQQQRDAYKLEQQLSDYQRSMLGLSSNRNLMSVIQGPTASAPLSNGSSILAQLQDGYKSGSFGGVSVVEEKKQQQEQSSQDPQPDDQQEGVSWLQSLTLSVSQLFAGSAAAPEHESIRESDEEDFAEADVIDEVAEGEVTDQDCDQDELTSSLEIRSKNTDVRKERIYEGQSLRKKIIFAEAVVTQKGASCSRSNYESSLLNAQSYNQVLSGSEEDASQQSRRQAQMISFTTSQRGKFTGSGKAKVQQNQRMRPSSNSFHDGLSKLGTSFSDLISGRKGTGVTSGVKQSSAMGALSPERISNQGVDAREMMNKSRFGALSRFFGKVIDSNQHQRPLSPDIENCFSTQRDERSPSIRGPRYSSRFRDERSSLPETQFVRRKHSKTLNYEKRPFLSRPTLYEIRKSEEKVRAIDQIVFNQNKTHFAVIWNDGGFTKFDVATLQAIQRVFRTPLAIKQSQERNQAEEFITTMSCADRNYNTRKMGNMQISKRVFSKNVPDGLEVPDNEDVGDFFTADDSVEENQEMEVEKFSCLALQHHTRDYIATLESDPKQVIHVHILDEISKQKKTKAELGERTLVRHFKEKVSRIEILPEARYTLICLQSAIYVYSKNSSDLYDIVPCSEPILSSAVYRQYEQQLVLAYLCYPCLDDPGETIEVHDYLVCPRSGTDTVYTIAKPFGIGYKIGGIQLDELGRRIVVISYDGCYVYLYSLEEQVEEKDQAQDQATPGYDSVDNIVQEKEKTIIIKEPQQQFARGPTRCNQIYSPIQIIEGFSISNHVCDFILLSTSSMTSHLFALKTPAELEDDEVQPKETGGFFSRFLPSTFTLDRSKIRLDILQELAPAEPLILPNRKLSIDLDQAVEDSDQATNPHQDSVAIVDDEEGVKQPGEYPYTCFVEQSGLLVAISHSGYCCKFSIDLQSDPSMIDLQRSGFQSMRPSQLNPRVSQRGVNQENGLMLSQARLSYSLDLMKDKGPPIRRKTQKLTRARTSIQEQKQKIQESKTQPSSAVKELPILQSLEKCTSSPFGGPVTPLLGLQTSLSPAIVGKTESNLTTIIVPQIPVNELKVIDSQPIATPRKATPFDGYRQPVLRLKFKMQDFFTNVDHKADSLRRIRQHKLQEKRLQEYKEFLQRMHQQRAMRQSQGQSIASDSKISQLKRLLTWR